MFTHPLRLAPIALAIATLFLPHAGFSQTTAEPGSSGAVSTLPEIAVKGTSDPTTENTGSYGAASASSATKLNLKLRETPQSISVITRTQMDDFGLQSANDALTYTTGVNVERVETDRNYYSVRGFDVSNFQLDGVGLPFSTGDQIGDIDTAVYDRIEVLRGANGLMSSTGNPSATINFIRKRPTTGFQASAGVTVGSWDKRRVDGDISGALNESGTVRGRLVAAKQTGDSYLDRYSLDKTVYSAIVEADLSDSTLLTIGHMQQKNKADSPMWGALPFNFTNGEQFSLHESTSTSADWAFWNTTDTQTFAELEQQLGGDWKAKLSLNDRTLKSDSELFYVFGLPDATTGLGLFAWPSKFTGREHQKLADLHATGPFTLGGRKHDLVVGANWSRSENTMLSIDDDAGTALPPVPQAWEGNFPRPAFDGAPSGSADFTDHRRSLYAMTRFNLSDQFKLITGANLTDVESRGTSYGVAHRYSDSKVTPYLGAVYDIDQHHSLYASYAEIFNPQNKIDANHAVLDPIEGSSVEAGIKGEWFNNRLNASFAVFQAKQNNFAESAGFDAGIGQTVYRGSDATSTGFELDVAGQISKNWQVSAGYTQLRLKDEDGENARLYVPRRTLHATTTYKVPSVAGLKLGASMKWQDDIERVQGTKDLSGNDIITRQKAYALLNLMAQYQIDKNFTATLNLNNVADKKYINSLYWDQAFYGAPRNVTVALNWKY